jgi:signal recognition particle subunit SRP19
LRKKGKLILWPAYFDTDRSWSQGRRVSKKLAIRGIKAEEILKAASDLGLNPVLNSGAAFSKHPWLKTGAVMVDKVGPKTEVLKDLAQRIRRNRA